ncbi:DciA family protein [Corynebacterium auriscanis]|uniref:DciA family protein n=1 Tax=Corynebacterium auriscanis TaxID=99807 RepID=UPI0024AD8612|nr:DciA family protein [Corynebacterium auriscanis]WJY71694.1 hypothetical protein CAURIC_00020 [Corynebacterium auriscanis]
MSNPGLNPNDPVAQALAQLRKAGANPQVDSVPRGASERKEKKYNKRRITTRLDGRADRSYRQPKRFGALIMPEIKRNGWNQHYAVGLIMNSWEELVGEKIGSKTKPIKYDPETKQLFIQCESTPWATQLRLIQTKVLHTIVNRVGPNVVAELKILNPEFKRPGKGKLRVRGRGPRDDFG